MRRLLKFGAFALAALVLSLLVAAMWARGRLQASLPVLDGQVRLRGLEAPVTVDRDALGIPTIGAASRLDVARALGFLHAQDRYFQMDLSRRRAAGELAALVGPRAVALDREIRVHRFRAVARRAVALMAPADRALVHAYAAGVNAGLGALGEHPFEYLLLRQAPAAWRPEDTVLVVLSMFVTLQDTDGSYESTLATMSDVLPPEMFAFMAPEGTAWDAPVVGGPLPMPPVPAREIYDVRERRRGRLPVDARRIPRAGEEAAALGSNNFAVAGRLTADGGALVANDMHLAIRVPNTWYRASWRWGGETVTGVTLPGVPAMVVGSNTHIAWGFTNTYADWSDLVLLEIDPQRPDRYRTPDGWRAFDEHEEIIEVAGQEPRRTTVRWTIWGPVLGADHRGRLRAYRWAAHAADSLAASMMPMEAARTIEEAFDSANGLGTPGQNLVVADRSGRIGWSIYGAIPKRVGFDGRLPASWADGTRGWNGWLDKDEYPRLLDGRDGRIWTANARVVNGALLQTLGAGSYEVGARASIIRDRLMARDRFTPRDLLDVQLDASAAFLERWRGLILETLTPQAVQADERRARLRTILERGWTGQASPDSAAYRIARAFRELVSERVFVFVLADCYEADARFDYTQVRQREGPVWRIVREQPAHMLDPQYASWQEMLLDSIDTVIETLAKDGQLEERRWSEFNVPRFRHPLSRELPLVDAWLDMPPSEIPGDLYTPRMMWGASGASERMVVSPGREEQGIMHMPTGQSGHPLSPFYANSHDAWVKGAPTPFLPGPTQHSLRLRP